MESHQALVRLEGFNIRAAYKMAKRNWPRLSANEAWEYPSSKDVLKECGLCTIEEYIWKRLDTIAVYVATRPFLRRADRVNDREDRCEDNGGGNSRCSKQYTMLLMHWRSESTLERCI
jgi:hypothetical protein